MSPFNINLIHQAIYYAKQGIEPEDATVALRGKLQNVSQSEIDYAVNYAYNAYGLGEEASSGVYSSFAEIPGINFAGKKLRVRLFVQGVGMQAGQGGTMDVLTIPGASIRSVIEYGEEYAQRILEQRDTLPGGNGNPGDYVVPQITITAIFPEVDGVTRAQRTVEGIA